MQQQHRDPAAIAIEIAKTEERLAETLDNMARGTTHEPHAEWLAGLAAAARESADAYRARAARWAALDVMHGLRVPQPRFAEDHPEAC